MTWAAAWWELSSNPVRKDYEPHEILLIEHDIGQRCRQITGIIKLADAVRAVVHRGTGIDQQVTAEIGFFFVLLDIIAVELGIGLPVDVENLIPRRILAMFGELDAEPLVGTGVKTGDQPFHDIPGAEQEARNLGERERIEIVRFVGHQGRSGWISASKRSMICSEVMRSGSAASAAKLQMMRCRRTDRASACTSSTEAAKRPCSTARALAPRMRYCEARGPAPQLTQSLTKAGACGCDGRVACTSLTA